MGTDDSRDYVSRDEFEGFEKNVSRSFRELGDSIRDLRSAVSDISTRGTNWTAILGALSLAVTIIMGVGAIVAWGLSSQAAGSEHRLNDLSHAVGEHVASPGHGVALKSSEDIDKRLTVVEAQLRESL